MDIKTIILDMIDYLEELRSENVTDYRIMFTLAKKDEDYDNLYHIVLENLEEFRVDTTQYQLN